MADIIDVQNALCALIAQAIYPLGTSINNSAGLPTQVYAGWPQSSKLDADLNIGKCHVSVFPKAEERNVTRYSTDQQVIKSPVTMLTAVVAGQTITIGGTVTVPQNIAVFVNGLPFTYAVQITDTLTSIAAALAASILASVSGTSNTGPVITVGATGRVQTVRVGASGTVAAEVRRQERVFQITIWANTAANRDILASTIDVALAQTRFLTLADGFGGRLVYKNSFVTDNLQKAHLYRRDLNYSVEYATTVTQSAPVVIVEQLNVTGGIDPTAPVIKTIYS